MKRKLVVLFAVLSVGMPQSGWSKDQIGVALSHECYDDTTFALEYISGDYQGGGDRSMITAQLAVGL